MSWKDYPALSERCYLETLPNGLRLRVVPKPGFAGKFAFLGVNFGSCDTQLPQSGGWQPVPDGTAHFLEHRMFCLPDCDPETEFSRLGAEANAFTDYAMTGYYFTCTDRFDDCLRLLLRMVSTPYFPQEAMVDERADIADVQLDDLLSIRFHLPRSFENRSTDVVTYICQLLRFVN